MSIGNTTENDWLNLFFRAQAMAGFADNAASSPETNIAVAAHTSDPGDTGTMSTNEIAFTGYARPNVARTTGGWSAPSGGAISPAAAGTFGTMTAGAGGTITHCSTGKTGGGAAQILLKGAYTPNQVVNNGVEAKFNTGSVISID